ncbi:MAG TPA: hypothetical protein PKY31_00475 [Spirochaetota bacterium]|nr:hypothetical protein [Spirochaetota bacterium]
MKKIMPFFILFLLLTPLHAQLNDSTMMIITYRVLNDELPVDSFYLNPKRLYRMGTRYGRFEEMYNPATGIHMHVIIDEPHIWIVNLKTNSAQYHIDEGPVLEFHAPMFPAEKQNTLPPLSHDCEFGHEFKFLRNNKAVKSSVNINNAEYDRYHAKVDRYEVVLISHKGKEIPWKIELKKDGKSVVEYEYLEYEKGLPFRKELFECSAGVTIEK